MFLIKRLQKEESIMKLFINEKNSWGVEKFDILDEFGEVCYFVEGESINTRDILHLYTNDKKEIGIIEKKLLGFISQFYVEIYDELFGIMEIGLGGLILSFNIDLFRWKIKRNLWGTKYTVYKDKNLISNFVCSQKGANSRYEINIFSSEDEMQMILLVLVIHTINSYKLNKNIAIQ